jgi:hypothetical protein
VADSAQFVKKRGKDPAKSKWFTPENRSSLWPNWLILRTHSYDMCNHSNLETRLFDDNLPMLLLMVCLAKSLSTTLHSAAFPKWLNSMSYFWQRFNSFFLNVILIPTFHAITKPRENSISLVSPDNFYSHILLLR